MSPAAAEAAEPPWTRWLPLLLVPVALLGDLGAAFPLRSYYFRDFTVTFLPLRLFTARELREGRLPFWNPYLFEGTFQLPALYPPDLLHAAWPSPVFVSWLLTLHLPLAALGAYWLVRELGASRMAGFVSGALFALCGFTLSCLNLYVFLQALALAPFAVGLLRRASLAGGRWCVAGAVAIALATSTLAVEFVAQALLLGLVVGGLANGWRGLGRGLGTIGLGLGLAGLPIMLVLGLLPETARGAGFERGVALANAVHPVVLLQALLPNLFGLPSAPGEAWWGGRFFSKGLPYFLCLYVGPLGLALAVVGLRALGRGLRVALSLLAALGLWYALGEAAGLAGLVQHVPVLSVFRFPSKGLLLPQLSLVLAAGFGADGLREGKAFRRLAIVTGGFALFGTGVAAVMHAAGGLDTWAGVRPSYWPQVVRVATRDAAFGGLVAVATALTAVAVRRGVASPRTAGMLVAALLAADLGRASGGINRQVEASFFDPLPALGAALSDGGRVFSYGLDRSPAFRAFLLRGEGPLTLAGFFVQRQILGPYTNMLDRVESPEAADLTAFAPRLSELGPELYEPERVGLLLPWLRNAAVSRIVSLDALSHPDLSPLGGPVELIPGRISAHLYQLDGSWTRAYMGCRAESVTDLDAALLRPYQAGFAADNDVALDARSRASCHKGKARQLASVPGRERFETEIDGDGYLVVRSSYARGWHAHVDGRPALVLRANGKHRAVPVPAGRHQVVLSYHPPGLLTGTLLSALSALGCLFLLVRRPTRPKDDRA